MRAYLIICLIFLLTSCSEKIEKQGLKVIDKSIGLSMIVPDSFSKLDEETKLEKVQKGKKVIEDLHDSVFVLNDIQKANIFSHDDNNMFVLNTQNYDFETQGEYRSAINNINKLIYETQVKNYPETKIDSSTTIEIIDGIEFMKFTLNATISKNATMHMVNYNHLFDNKKDLTAAVIFTDEALGKAVLKSFKAAKFKK